MIRRTLALALVAALAAAGAGCGARTEAVTPRRLAALKLSLIAPNAGEAPLYAATATGSFSQAGLSVSTSAAATPAQSLSRLAAGDADLAVSTAPALLEARDRGLHVVAVAALVNGPLSATIWLPGSGVRGVADLARRRIGTPGLDYQTAFAATVTGTSAGRLAIVDVGAAAAGALEHRRVDAVVGALSNQDGVALRAAGRHPSVTAVDSRGVPPFDELVVAAREGALGHDADAIRSFLGALARSTRGLRSGSQASVAAFAHADPALAGNAATVALRETLPLLLPSAGRPYGYQDAASWRRFSDWMRSAGLLLHGSDPAHAFTNAYLPGVGL